MIKATVKSFSGNEFKTPKEVFIWIGIQHGDIENVNVLMTFQNSEIEAKENTIVKTDKSCQAMVGLKEQLVLKVSDIGSFTDFETMKEKIQAKIIEGLNGLNLPHIINFELC